MDRVLKKQTKLFVEFMHPQFCLIAKTFIELRTSKDPNYKDIECDYALDVPANAPTATMKDLVANSNYDTGECAHCSTDGASLVCSRCATDTTSIFYCGSECQIQHWDFHRWECSSLPKLIENADKAEYLESKKKAKISNFMPKLQDRLNLNDFVIVVHVESPVSWL